MGVPRSCFLVIIIPICGLKSIVEMLGTILPTQETTESRVVFVMASKTILRMTASRSLFPITIKKH